MANDDTRDLNLLDQYWDARGQNADAPDELEDSLRRTVEGFHAADDTPAPDEAFVDRLWTDLTGAASSTASAGAASDWTDDPNEGPGKPQFVGQRRGGRTKAEQQSTWRRRAKQVGEMVAAAVLLAVITGGLILAYQNLIGEGDGDSSPAGGDDAGLVPELSAVAGVDQNGPILDRGVIDTIAIDRHDGQDYAFLLTSADHFEGRASGSLLQSLRLDDGGDHEVVGALELDLDWTREAGYEMGHAAIIDDVLYAPIAAREQPGVWAIDVADPEQPEEVSFIETPGGIPRTVAASDGIVVASGTVGNILSFIDITDPEQPSLVDQIETGAGEFYAAAMTPSLTISDDTLYVAHPHTLSVYDVSDPEDPEEIGSYENPNWQGSERSQVNSGRRRVFENNYRPDAFHDVAVIDDYAYLAAGERGVLIIDISEPSDPVQAGEVTREDRTFRLTRADRYLYVLGVSDGEQSQQEFTVNLSIDAMDVSDSDDPRIVNRLEDIASAHDREDVSSIPLMMNVRQTEAGRDFVLAYGVGGTYVSRVNWVEPTDDSADTTPLPTSEPEASSIDMPEQDPREIAIEMIAAIDVEAWDRLRELTVEPFSEMGDEAIQYAYRYLRVPDREGDPAAVGIDAWDVETYQLWALVYHTEIPVFRLVMVPDRDTWLYDPGPHMLAHARVVDTTGEPSAVRDAITVVREARETNVHDVDDPEKQSVLSRLLAAGQPSIQFDGETPIVGFMLELSRSERAVIDLADVTWQAGGERGPVEMFWTDAMLEADGSRIVVPGNPDGIVRAYFGFRLEGVPAGAETFAIEFQNVEISGVSLSFPQIARDVDDIELTARFAYRLESTPDLKALESGDDEAQDDEVEPAIDTGNATVYFPRQPAGDHEYDDGAPLGELALDDQGCLRFGAEDGPVIIWPYEGYSVDLVDGEVALINEGTGDVIANVGDRVSFHGSDPTYAPPEVPEHRLLEPLPDACADVGGYFITGPGIGGS